MSTCSINRLGSFEILSVAEFVALQVKFVVQLFVLFVVAFWDQQLR